MKATRESVEEWAKEKGLEPIQIDGIPEGFSFKEPDLTVNEIEHKGRILKIKPLSEFEITYE